MRNQFEKFDDPIRMNQKLHSISRFKKYSAAEIIIGENDHSNNVYFLLSGRVKITNFSPKGREVWHNELGAGKTFGEMAAISGNPRATTVVTIVESQVAIISKSELFDLLRHDPDLCFWIMEDIVRRLNLATVKFYELLSLSIPLRVRAELLRLSERKNRKTTEIHPLPNFSELAKKINTDRENVSREISNLVKLGIIEKHKDKIVILNEEFLIETTSI